jgi:hypothetical protein
MDKTYSTIPEFPAYEISTDGHVRRKDSHRTVKAHKAKNGYYYLQLFTGGGKFKTKKIHILLLETFEGPRPSPKHVAHHIDEDKDNNTYFNLEWKLGTKHLQDHNRHRRKLNSREIKEIRESNASLTSLAERYNVDRKTIWSIKKGNHYADE